MNVRLSLRLCLPALAQIANGAGAEGEEQQSTGNHGRRLGNWGLSRGQSPKPPAAASIRTSVLNMGSGVPIAIWGTASTVSRDTRTQIVEIISSETSPSDDNSPSASHLEPGLASA